MSEKAVGILMLETQFPRPVGDIGNPRTFDFPVLYQTVPMANPDLVVRGDPGPLLPAFIDAGRDLIARGAKGISTSCGFLTVFQDELSQALDVPVLTSSLFQVAGLRSQMPAENTVGILTISASSLTPAHLEAANVPMDCPIGTTESGQVFTNSILRNADQFDFEIARKENVSAARDLKLAYPHIAALVLECTNMGPYASAISDSIEVPVFSAVSALQDFQSKL